MSIDWVSVNWGYVALLSGFTFIAALIANFIMFGHRFVGAILTALLFAAVFVFATYYPHGIALPKLKYDRNGARSLDGRILQSGIRLCRRADRTSNGCRVGW